jgi:hypothetical protein
MAADDITLKVLIEIRDELRSHSGRLDQTNARLDQTNARLDQTNVRLDQMREELGTRIVESELRTATAITELASTLRNVHVMLEKRLDLRDRVDQCERDIADLKRRVG